MQARPVAEVAGLTAGLTRGAGRGPARGIRPRGRPSPVARPGWYPIRSASRPVRPTPRPADGARVRWRRRPRNGGGRGKREHGERLGGGGGAHPEVARVGADGAERRGRLESAKRAARPRRWCRGRSRGCGLPRRDSSGGSEADGVAERAATSACLVEASNGGNSTVATSARSRMARGRRTPSIRKTRGGMEREEG